MAESWGPSREAAKNAKFGIATCNFPSRLRAFA